MSTQAPVGQGDGGVATPDRKPLAPIPPGAQPGGAQAKGAPTPDPNDPAAGSADDRPRDDQGRFTSGGDDQFDEVDPDTGRPINPHNYPKATLPGMPDETLEGSRGIRAQRRKPMRQQFAEIGKAMAVEAGEKVAPPAAAQDGTTAAVSAQPAVDGQVAAQSAAQPAASADPNVPVPAAEKFITLKSHRDPKTGQWVDESWDTKEQFENHFRTLRGMHQSEAKQKAEAQRDYLAANKAAEDWRALAKAYEDGTVPLPSRKSNGTPTGQAASAPAHQPNGGDDGAASRAPEEEFIETVDWEMHKRITEHPQQGPNVAAAWLAQQAVKFNHEANQRLLAERDRPAREENEVRQAGQAIRAQIESMREWTTPDGSAPFYPELQDPSVLPEIAAAINQLHADEISLDYLKSPKGVHQAILLWRNWRERVGRPWSANGNGHAPATGSTATSPPANGVAAAVDAISQHNAQVGGVLGGRNAPMRVAPPMSAEALVKRAITGPQKMSDLGYSWD
jgi:hypothetical protein